MRTKEEEYPAGQVDKDRTQEHTDQDFPTGHDIVSFDFDRAFLESFLPLLFRIFHEIESDRSDVDEPRNRLTQAKPTIVQKQITNNKLRMNLITL